MSKKQKTWIAAVVTVVIIIGLVLVFANMRAQGSSSNSGATPAYQTTTVQRGTLTSTVEGTGSVRSNLSAIINWLNSGQVAQVNAQIGSRVKAGDVLATLVQDSTMSTLQANLLTAQENLAELTSPSAIANAELAVTTAQANVINAQAAVNNLKYWQNAGLIQDYYAADGC